jgi:hypothetical protein
MTSSQQQVMDSLKLVRVDNVLKGFVEEAYENLNASLDKDDDASTNSQKNLLLALHEAKQKLFRLDILCQWAQKAKAAVQCKRVLDSCCQDGDALVGAADQLAYLHSELLYTRTPIFDVPLSFRILGEGNVNILPSRIWKDVMTQDPASSGSLAFRPNKWQDDDGMKEMMLFILKSKLIQEEIEEYPFKIKFDRDNSSIILTSKESLYQVTLCLVPSPTVQNILQKWKNEHEQEDGDEVMLDDAEQEHQGDHFNMWRWRTLSAKILPDLEVSSSYVSSTTIDFVKQSLDERIWASSDLQVLRQLGLQDKLSPNFEVTSIQSPLLEVEKLLRSVSNHILVGVILLDAARKLEAGSWKSSLKAGKPSETNGIRIEIWCGLPVLTQDEYEKIQDSDCFDEVESVAEGHTQAALEIHIASSTSLSTHIYPSIYNGDSTIRVRELCKPDSYGNENLNNILLKIASSLAANQLQGIMASLRRQVEQHYSSLHQYSSVFYRAGETTGKQSPMIDLITCNEGILSLSINLKTGYPLYMLGSSILEDGVAYEKAFTAMQSASTKLSAEIRQFKVSSVPEKTTRAMYLCKIIAKHTLGIWSEIVSLTSLCHLLKSDPFLHLSRCLHVPGVLQKAEKYIICYEIESSRVVEVPKGLLPRAKQQNMDHLVGYLTFETDLGNLGFQDAKFYVYEKNESSVIIKEREIFSGGESWKRILDEASSKDFSGNKRSRSEAILSSPYLHSQLSESTRKELLKLENVFLKKFAEETVALQFENLMIKAVTKPTDDDFILFECKIPRSILQSQQGFLSNEKSLDALVQFNYQMSSLVMTLTGGEEIVSALNKTTFQSSTGSTCSVSGSSITIGYKDESKIASKGIWGEISDLFRIVECQRLATSLVGKIYHDDIRECTFHERKHVKLKSIDIDSIHFDIDRTNGDGESELHCEAKICWGDVEIDHTSWPDGDTSLKCTPKVTSSRDIPTQVQENLNKVLENAVRTYSIEDLTSFLSSLAQL